MRLQRLLFILLTVMTCTAAYGQDTEAKGAHKGHFSWGAILGSSIDMTGQDMTSFDIDAMAGYRNDRIRFLGVGAGIKSMISNGSRTYPVYALFRTDMFNAPSPVFLQFKAGISFSNFYHDYYQRNFICGAGVGFVLAHGTNFSSHVVLSYEYLPVRDIAAKDNVVTELSDIHYATLKIGVSF